MMSDTIDSILLRIKDVVNEILLKKDVMIIDGSRYLVVRSI